jgi:hypothetical protein
MIRVAAFDMGTRNFAFSVEEYKINSLPLKIKGAFDINGYPNESYQTFLDQNYKQGSMIHFECIDLLQHLESLGGSDKNNKNIYLALTHILNTFSELWDNVDVFLIEQQMAYGKNKSNIQALRLAQHCQSYFITIYGSFKIIQEFSSTHKTRILGCPIQQRKKHKDRKKFAIQLASDILTQRSDPLYPKFDQLSKKDDVADCILMIQAYKVRS